MHDCRGSLLVTFDSDSIFHGNVVALASADINLLAGSVGDRSPKMLGHRTCLGRQIFTPPSCSIICQADVSSFMLLQKVGSTLPVSSAPTIPRHGGQRRGPGSSPWGSLWTLFNPAATGQVKDHTHGAVDQTTAGRRRQNNAIISKLQSYLLWTTSAQRSHDNCFEHNYQKSTFGASLRFTKYSSFIAASCRAIAVSSSSSRPVLRFSECSMSVVAKIQLGDATIHFEYFVGSLSDDK